jgi:cell division protein FtsL
MEKLIMVDQARRQFARDEKRRRDTEKRINRINSSGEDIISSVFALILLVFAIFILSAAAKAQGIAYDVDYEKAELVASQEMDEYLSKCVKCGPIELGDLQ